jgi:hypothetical protein
MKREKFVQDAKAEPERYYRNPTDILRDRRLTDADRVDILDAWERREEEAAAEPQPASEGVAEETRLDQIRRTRREVGSGARKASAPSGISGGQ